MKVLRVGIALALMMTAGLTFAATAAKPGLVEKKAGEGTNAIEGVEIARPNGGFLGLEIKNNNFLLTFYDAQKEKTAPDMSRAMLRWSVKYQPQDERAVLAPGGDGTSLTSSKNVRTPHNFKVFIGLFVEGNESAVETYNVDVRG